MTRRGKLHDPESTDLVEDRPRTVEEKTAFDRFIKKVEEAYPHLKAADRSERKRAAGSSMRSRRILRGIDF